MPVDFSGAQFGLIQQLKTGNPHLDMALCMLIPAFFAWLFTVYESRVVPWWQALMKRLSDNTDSVYRRDIEFELMRNSWGSVLTGKEERNNVLQKAITLYLADQGITYRQASCSLMQFKQKRNYWDDDDENDNKGAGALRQYRITTVAPNNTWVEVREGLEFRQSTDENQEGDENNKINKKKIVFSFKSDYDDGEERIQQFLDDAWKFYLAELDKSKDVARYMYNMIAKDPFGKEEDSNSDAKKYKRYKLSDEKTFASLFFPDKEKLLMVLEHFKEKTGKYGIPGYPHKLGLLLHGPPGTGKTSLIKALANATGRSIVNIPLARIKTNQELTDLVYDLRFSVPGEDVPVKLGYKDIIFVMEDVDAASRIVHRRGNGPSNTKVSMQSTKINASGEASTTTVTRQVSVPAPPPLPDSDDEDGPMGAVGPSLPGQEEDDLMMAIAASLGDDSGGDKATGFGNKSGFLSRTDKLDLSGLLNVLDGVVDTPNRILVMTTNHPEKLDPALIRPGRIDKKIFLGYMRGTEACDMLQHYYPDEKLTADHRGIICDLLDQKELDLTPAQIEQICAENDSVQDMLKALWQKTEPVVARRGLSRAASLAVQ